MILEITTAAMITCNSITTGGTSELANFIGRQSAENLHSLRNSSYFGDNLRQVFSDLYTVAEECKSANWDAQGASAVSEESYRAAFRFLEALPLGAMIPNVGAEPDGEMTLEWFHSPRRALSVSFSKNGELHYAALIGSSKVYGTEPFFGEIPRIIIDTVSRIFAV